MDGLSSTEGIVAIAAAGVAVVALVLAIVLAVRLHRVRAAQLVLFAGHGQQDLVVHAARIQQEFRVLTEYVEEVAGRLNGRMEAAEARLDRAVAHTALVRYDAYHELSGQQSASLALLDTHATGLVLSSILHRDQARLYCKRVVEGKGEYPLSPEEEEAVRLALAGEEQRVR